MIGCAALLVLSKATFPNVSGHDIIPLSLLGAFSLVVKFVDQMLLYFKIGFSFQELVLAIVYKNSVKTFIFLVTLRKRITFV